MNRTIIRRAALVALTITFGLQTLRVFLPTVIWYLGQFIIPEGMALLALGVFATALLAPLVYRFLGERRTLGITAGGLALVYLGLGLADRAPLYLALSALGVVLFAWFLVIWLRSPGERLEGGIPVLALAFPLALILDTAMRTLLWTFDLVWRHDLLAWGTALGLAALALFLLWRELRAPSDAVAPDEPPLRYSLSLIGLGAFLYLALANFHNPAAIAAASGWSDASAYMGANLFAALGALACVAGSGAAASGRTRWTLLIGALLVFAMAFVYIETPPAWLWYGLAAITAWAALGITLAGVSNAPSTRPGLWRTSLGVFLALVALLSIIFMVAQFYLYIAVFAGGVLLAFCAVLASSGVREPPPVSIRDALRLVGMAVILALVVTLSWAIINRTMPQPDNHISSSPLRVMTYNIHQGVNADMVFDLEGLVVAIQAEDPDVVALNEVNRARATNGFVDVLAYLSQRLDMPYVFGANYADGQYGNAVLTRHPIAGWENVHFSNNTNEQRGVLVVRLDRAPAPVSLYVTHLDHLPHPDDVRFEQVNELLRMWNGGARAVILGDLNADPRTPEIGLIYQAGFIDLLEATGKGEAFTFWYERPQPGQRIDYIFVTPDLPYGDAWVPVTRASDHLPVVGEIGP